VRLQHASGQALYREPLQAATLVPILFGFRKSDNIVALASETWRKMLRIFVYGLHKPEPPQFVALPPPPSAFTAVGVTKVVRNSTAAPSASSTCFTGFSFELRDGP